VVLQSGLFSSDAMNWTANQPSKDSAAYSGSGLGRVVAFFCHFDGNQGDYLILEQRSTIGSLFERCNFVTNSVKSILVVSNTTHIRKSIFIGNKARVISLAAGSGNPAVHIVGCYADDWTNIRLPAKITEVRKYDKKMTLIRMPRTPGDNCVFLSKRATFPGWICGPLAVIAGAGWGIQRNCGRGGRKRRGLRRGAQQIGKHGLEQDVSIHPSADDEEGAEPGGF
jgi:hypothetical protein